MSSDRRFRIRFTKHAREKFGFVKHYGFEIEEMKGVEAIQNPTHIDQKNDQYFTIKAINAKYALRVVYEKRKDYLLVITFYPVRRERYGI